jgi:hypothetical protein
VRLRRRTVRVGVAGASAREQVEREQPESRRR